jgi:flagellar basal-body rod modification protein FlgD
MSIDAITAGSSTSPSSNAGQGLQGSKDEFLKLFMAQLQHQDPFAPTSGADMVAQLAQLSSVEQAKQTNSQLAELAASQASAASAGLSTLIGRDCSAAVGVFTIDRQGGTPPPVDVSSTGPTKGAALVITGADGKELRRIAIPDGTTRASIAWDGKDASGSPVPAGSYAMTVDPGTTTSSVGAQWAGQIDAVELTPDGPRLRMGGVLLSPGDIRTIGASSTSTSATTATTGTTSTTLVTGKDT